MLLKTKVLFSPKVMTFAGSGECMIQYLCHKALYVKNAPDEYALGFEQRPVNQLANLSSCLGILQKKYIFQIKLSCDTPKC